MPVCVHRQFGDEETEVHEHASTKLSAMYNTRRKYSSFPATPQLLFSIQIKNCLLAFNALTSTKKLTCVCLCACVFVSAAKWRNCPGAKWGDCSRSGQSLVETNSQCFHEHAQQRPSHAHESNRKENEMTSPIECSPIDLLQLCKRWTISSTYSLWVPRDTKIRSFVDKLWKGFKN